MKPGRNESDPDSERAEPECDPTLPSDHTGTGAEITPIVPHWRFNKPL